MKLIRIFIAFVVVSLVVGVGSAFNGQNIQNEDITQINQNESKNQKDGVENIQKEEFEENESIPSEKEVSTETVENNQELNKEEIEVKQKEEPKQTQPKKQEQESENIIIQPKQEEKKVITPWEELGMTEDEYYNKPAWKWAKVDFAIEEYGSEDACFNACINYGESTGMGFSCSTINSASGRYLGEMIKLF